MNYLSDDVLSYLIEMILDDNCLYLSSFLVSTKIKLTSDIIINNKLKSNYKILIKDNYFKNPLQSYYYIRMIYGDKFIFGNDKLEDLLCLAIFNNNKELIDVLNKTLPNSLKSIKVKLYQSCDTNNHYIWELYSKLSGTPNNKTDYLKYILRNCDDKFLNFVKFKELIRDFCQIK